MTPSAVDEQLATQAPARGGLERLWELALFGSAGLSIFVTAGILAVLLVGSIDFFAAVPLRSFLLDTEWTPLFAEKRFGIWALVSGTALCSAVALLLAFPTGLLSAVFISEIAGQRSRRILKPALEILAGVPTIVYGWFALVVLTPILQKVVPGLAGFSALSAGLAMGLMVLPTVSSLSEDALQAVPRSLREASVALGASPLSTLFRVTLPTASSGLACAGTLALARAVGETMIVAIAAGQQPRFTADPRVPVQTMTGYMVAISMGDTPRGTLEYHTLFVVGAMLFLLTFATNLVARRLGRSRWKLG